jgi:hypothetical protein
MTLTLDGKDALIYRGWVQFMLGMVPSTCAMHEADQLYKAHSAAIGRVARAFAAAVLPSIWRSGAPVLYRGLRLADPDLHQHLLPPHPDYDALPALSFSEDRDVAAYFADSGPLGLPAPDIMELPSGRIRPALPPHGYIATATADADDLLFHWKYAVRFPWLVHGAEPDDLQVLFQQREVTVRNDPPRRLRLEAFTVAAAGYIADRYPLGRWIPPPALAAG